MRFWRRTKVQHTGTMPLVDHLMELRKRILISISAVFLCAVVVFIFYNPILHFLSKPYQDVTGRDLIVTDPLAPLIVRLKISGYGGLALAIPIVMWQIWRFVVPGLHQRERRYGVWFILSAVVLFVLGCVVAWFTMTKALEFLLEIGGPSITPLIDANKYLTLVMLMFAAFGVAFEFPLLLVFLMLVGVLNTRQLRASRRWTAVGISVFAAVITPSADPFSMLFMAIPMYLFFEISIVIGRVMKR
jgi:sec-independent protein translocase protein TatC